MTSLYDPTIEQAFKQTFENNFYVLAQQKRSLLANCPAVKYFAVNGSVHNIPRSDRTELVEASGRNPDQQLVDLRVDNRVMRVRRFTRTFLMDKKDVRESIANPNSTIYEQLMYACNRSQDKLIAEAATADVEVGDSEGAKTSRTAAQDGVITVDATSGLTYNIFRQLHSNFLNNNVINNDIMGANLTFAGAGGEHSDIMNEDKFINNDYTKFRRVDKMLTDEVGGVRVAIFAGSDTGASLTVANPILIESGSDRTCLMLAPQSIGYALRVKSFRYEEYYPGKVDSSAITVVLEQAAVRLEGARVQKVTTTI
jgi:hypothetical protein